MRKLLRFSLLVGVVAVVTACNARQEEVVVVPEPIPAEPVSNKY